MKLVIVESPSKAKTIRGYLGPGYEVRASMGHIRDLPPKELGVDVEHGFAPTYHQIRGKGDTIRELKERAAAAEAIYLATDPDREGEAIAWHVWEVIHAPRKPVQRIAFHEITPEAIQEALRHGRPIDMQLVNAQQARRVLDRLVGYQISPLLWRKVRRGLSAGRVQSVAVRLVVEREREIQAFTPEEYWTVEADLSKVPVTPEHTFRAVLYSVRGQVLGKFGLKTHDDAQTIVDDLQGAAYRVKSVTTKQVRRNPSPPFITSTLQREASSKLGLAPNHTMRIAQELYEGVELGPEGHVGLITYMRTDSTAVAQSAQEEARAYIRETWGAEYVPAKAPVYAGKVANAQEAHECIRPTSVRRGPQDIRQYLSRDQLRLYELIWQRFLASQMAPAILDQTTADIYAGSAQEKTPPYIFRATGSVVVFAGFLAVYQEEADEVEGEQPFVRPLPPLQEKEPLELVDLLAQQHWTEPPPRYSEATLIKELEKRGIGRPSTYASIVTTIQDRGYVEKMEPSKRKSPLRPTETGCVVNDLLVASFPDILDPTFTAQMEERLDQIAAGEREWVPVMADFYGPFAQALERAGREMRDVRGSAQETGLTCALCGKPMVVRFGRRGEFLACSGYPACKNAKEFTRGADGQIALLDDLAQGQTCDKCGRPFTVKKGKNGLFLACSGYPECRNTRSLPGANPAPDSPAETGEAKTCELCGKPMALRHSRYGPFWGCTGYPECRNTQPAAGEQKAGHSRTARHPVRRAADSPITDKPAAGPRRKKSPSVKATGRSKPRAPKSAEKATTTKSKKPPARPAQRKSGATSRKKPA